MQDGYKISVITPNYNHGAIIHDMLETTLSQSYPAYEIIIIEDGSTDNSREVIEDYALKYKNIKILYNEENKGITYSVNRGIDYATGDYIVFRSADDVSYPGFFEKSIQMLQQHPDTGICCSDAAFFRDDYHSGAEEPHGWSDGPRAFTPFEFAQVLKGQYIYGSTAVVKASAVRDVGGFLEGLNWSTDWFLMLAVAFRYGVCYIPETLAGNRVNPDSYAAAGMAIWEKQKPVVDAMIRYLRTDYRDILPYFNLSGCMNVFGPQMAEVILSNEEHWNAETLALVLRPLWEWNKKIDSQYTRSLATMIRMALMPQVEKIKHHARGGGVSIYGAGAHTKHLLAVWNNLELPKIQEIIVSQKPTEQQFMGFPVKWIEEMKDSVRDMIVLSSLSFEQAMSDMCMKILPHIPRIALWKNELSSEEFLKT